MSYPLKASQVNTSQTDADLKQECELLATKTVLLLLRERYPYLKFTFLGDALYANKPFIQFLYSLGFGYILVFTEIYRKYYTHQETVSKKGKILHRQAAWFNQADIGEGVYTNVLRFKEEVKNEDIIADVYEGMWLCSEPILRSNCFKRARKGRLRWDHEDVHNSCKNRGLDVKHDMARAKPNLLIVWKLLLFCVLCL